VNYMKQAATFKNNNMQRRIFI